MPKSIKNIALREPCIDELTRVYHWPSLFTGHSFTTITDLFPNADLNKVLEHCQISNNQRLGFRYESLIKAFIDADSDKELIQHNVQLIDNKQTMGELDFVYQQNNQLMHLEVAIKFYLAIEPYGFEHFVGPSKNDWLHLKAEKLINHQLKPNLSLLEPSLQHISASKALVQGIVFYPINTKINFPEPISTGAETGTWLTTEQLEHLPEQGFLLTKQQWLSGIGERFYNKDELIAQIQTWYKDNKQAVQVADKHNHRYMIVPNSWIS